MEPLEPPDLHRLRASKGWLELGCAAEALQELEGMPTPLQDHPEVLDLKWQIQAKLKNWSAAITIAAAMIQLFPDDPGGWINRSFALHELKRTEEARDNLLRVLDHFPDQVIMRYNLACYECQLGRIEKARAWLKAAFNLGDPDSLRDMARQDPDLEPMRSELDNPFPG